MEQLSDKVNEFLNIAKTYYDHGNQLIYTTLGNNFLRGGELYDEENGHRGRIDCSTYVHLILQGIPYEKSPYVTGNPEDFYHSDCPWADKEILNQFLEEKPIKAAFKLGAYYDAKGRTRSRGQWKPGDLLFFQIREERREEYESYGVYKAISHIAIVAEDGTSVYESSGTQTGNVAENVKRPGVRKTKISDKPKPIFYVSPF
ncbi:MAG: hypothetical protein MJ092_04920 [Lachnospiraceae bacterium]|nr:hypothetical protein [Lachnospiraceae bacterium]